MLEQIEKGIEGIDRIYLMRNDDIISMSVILLFVLFAFVFYRSRKVLFYKVYTFFSSRQTYAANEVSISNQEVVSVILLILIGCMSVSFIFYADMMGISQTVSHYGLLFSLFLCAVLLVGVKGILYSFINWIFFPPDQGKTWLSAYFSSVAFISTLAFMLSLLRVYSVGDIINVSHCIVTIVILQKIILLLKLFVNFQPKKDGGIVFFLYFCSAEVMPTLIAWHIISNMKL